VVAGAVQTSAAGAETLPPNGSELKFVGRYVTGAGLGGAEISAVDAASKRLFITNGAKNTIDIVDISNLKKPKLIKAVSFTASGATGIQSVAAKNGVVLVAAQMASKTAPGRIFVMDINGKLRPGLADGITVGALPDSVTISPDGKYAIVANEGEPLNYCLTNGELPETTDPLGSISIINLSSKTPTATTLDFKGYTERKNAITYAGGRIFGPNASLAQDIEPEYAAFSADSKFAYVTLQENNAIATVDVATGAIINIVGLGVKNHNVFDRGLDSSDRDNVINIEKRNIQGMYLPDAIGTVDAGGNTYMVTANEGDAREYACLLGGTDPTKLEAEDARFA
ncbi:MAG: alkaline phosphatase, partial [Actinobacteria bacterium]|nr:alkaline phosphatase [Actinomycetota bacterium]